MSKIVPTPDAFQRAVADVTRRLEMASRDSVLAPKSDVSSGSIDSTYLMAEGVKSLESSTTALIEKSKTSPEAFDSLRYAIAVYILDEKPLPDALREWLVRFLQGKIATPVRQRGRKSSSMMQIHIMWAVQAVVEKGFSATRNDTSDPQSACDIVASALCQAGYSPMAYEGVKKIWFKVRKHKDDYGNVRLPG